MKLRIILTIAAVCAAAFVPLPSANPSATSLPPSFVHFLGTTPLGQDVFRLCVAALARATFEALWASVLTAVVGTTIGLVAAARVGGLVDGVQALLSALLDTLGVFLLAACLSTVLPRIDRWSMGIVLALLTWPHFSQVVRAEALAACRLEFVVAARALGGHRAHIFVRHIAPVMLLRLLPHFFGSLTSFVAVFGALGFIGLGTSTELTLGYLVFDSLSFARSTPWYAFSCFASFGLLLGLLASVLTWPVRHST